MRPSAAAYPRETPPPAPRRTALAIASAAWALSVAGGAGALIAYQSAPGLAPAAPAHWPAAPAFDLDPVRPTLVMFAHPRCPCARASLAELRALLDRPDPPAAHLAFAVPDGADQEWTGNDFWFAAAKIRGLVTHADRGGRLAAACGARTSGQVMIFTGDGSLLYSGGLTGSRGHEGGNGGLDAASRALDTGAAAPSFPVFGCSLLGMSGGPGVGAP